MRPSHLRLTLLALVPLSGCPVVTNADDTTDGAVDTVADAATVDAGADALTDIASSAPCDEEHPDHTVGLQSCSPGAFDGYTLLAPMGSKDTYLIDLLGRVVHTWSSAYRPGLVAYLLDDGHLLRTASTAGPNSGFPMGGGGGRLEELDWDGALVWEYACGTDTSLCHHDVERLPNGNTLVIAWEKRSAAEAIAAGRDPATVTDGLFPDAILEIAPTGASGGEVVWEWRAWDHLVQDYDPSAPGYGVVADHPELIDVNAGATGPNAADWTHLNAVDYNAERDEILVSSHAFSEIWIIDHATTTAEAAGHTGGARGHGGDLLYRWGRPEEYGAGTGADRTLYAQHDAHWVDDGLVGAGDILIFNNGMGRADGDYSSVDEIAPPIDEDGAYRLGADGIFGPDEPIWSYVADTPEDFFSSNISGAQRLPNGNTLVCSGAVGRLFEVTADGRVVWSYVNPVTNAGPLAQGDAVPTNDHGSTNTVFRAYRYAPDHPGLAGRDLTPGDTLETGSGD